MLRSRDVALYDIIFPKDYAWEIMDSLGRVGQLCFEDLNKEKTAKELPFENDIKDLTTSLEKLEEIEGVMREHGVIEESLAEGQVKESVGHLQEKLRDSLQTEFYTNLKARIDESHTLALEMRKDYLEIQNKISQSNNYIGALQKFLEKIPVNFKNKKTNISFADLEVQLTYILGCLKNEDVAKFQRSLFRVTRGNVFATYSGIEQEDIVEGGGKIKHMTVVFIAFQASSKHVLERKIKKLSEAFGVELYDIPEDMMSLKTEIARAYSDNFEAHKVLQITQARIFDSLNFFAEKIEGTDLQYLSLIKSALYKQLVLYENLNKLERNGRFMVGNFWIAVDNESEYHRFIIEKKDDPEFKGFRHHKIDHRQTKKEPPSLFLNNSFIFPFQEVIDTYGTPNYKEINPALFTIITFPYMFGVMFGDFGHGLLLTCFSISLFLFNSKTLDSAKPYRSLLLFMGLFSCYCGLVYNEFLSVPIPIFKSCYDRVGLQFIRKENCIYPFGFDFAWDMSNESISFLNSFKMKLSIIIGVIHMCLGIFLKGLNKLKFRDYLSFFFEFLPQITFMLCTFGYMCFLIILKWNTDFVSSSDAPSIITLFINFVASVDQPLLVDSAFQLRTQQILAIIAVVCIPVMFFVKPLILIRRQTKEFVKRYSIVMDENFPKYENPELEEEESQAFISRKNSSMIQEEEETHDATELFVHQGIETIEFVLGSVSNTASYLRLWALSLAHSQLAKVFLSMLVQPYYSGDMSLHISCLFLPVMFVMFFFVTVGVLMIMDLMECFLHALRLHWVEFQNKFYAGEGKSFVNFEFIGLVKKKFVDAQY